MKPEIQTALPFATNDATMKEISIDQLVVEVYESAPSEQKEKMVAQLVGKVYKDAPPDARGRMLEHLLKPLGVLSLLTVANGVFAKARFRGGWTTMQVQLDDIKNVQASDVAALVDYVQHVSIQVVDGLGQLLAAQPALASSSAAAVLVSVLMKRAKFRRIDD